MKKHLTILGIVLCMVMMFTSLPAPVEAAADYSGQTFSIPLTNEAGEEGSLGIGNADEYYGFRFSEGLKKYTVEKKDAGYVITGDYSAKGTKLYFYVVDTTIEGNSPTGYDSGQGDYFVDLTKNENKATVWDIEEGTYSGACLKTTVNGKTYYVNKVNSTKVDWLGEFYTYGWVLRLTGSKAAAYEIDLHAHNQLSLIEEKSATCTTDGNIAHYKCSCGALFLDSNGQNPTTASEVKKTKLGHDWSEEIEDDTHLKSSATNCQGKNEYWFDCGRDNCTAISTDKYFTSETKSGPHQMSTEWETENEKHYHKCEVVGCTYIEDETSCTGGEATCKTLAKCGECGESYGTLDADNHEGTADWTRTEDTHAKVYDCCGVEAVAEEAHEYDNDRDATCNECGYEREVSGNIPPAGDDDNNAPSDDGSTDDDKEKPEEALDESSDTGDETNLFAWLSLMILSGAGATGAAIYNRRRSA